MPLGMLSMRSTCTPLTIQGRSRCEGYVPDQAEQRQTLRNESWNCKDPRDFRKLW